MNDLFCGIELEEDKAKEIKEDILKKFLDGEEIENIYESLEIFSQRYYANINFS